MRIVKVALLVWLVLAVVPARGQSADREWAQFLARPNERNYQVLVELLRACHDAACSQQVSPSSPLILRLLRLVDHGNPYAVDLAFLSLPFLDGGDNEDVKRALGSLTETHPILFLKGITEHHLTSEPYKLHDLLTMLPLNTADNWPAKRRTVRRRIKALSGVHDASLLEARNQALSILNGYLSEHR